MQRYLQFSRTKSDGLHPTPPVLGTTTTTTTTTTTMAASEAQQARSTVKSHRKSSKSHLIRLRQYYRAQVFSLSRRLVCDADRGRAGRSVGRTVAVQRKLRVFMLNEDGEGSGLSSMLLPIRGE
jgi:hypothetical protein